MQTHPLCCNQTVALIHHPSHSSIMMPTLFARASSGPCAPVCALVLSCEYVCACAPVSAFSAPAAALRGVTGCRWIQMRPGGPAGSPKLAMVDSLEELTWASAEGRGGGGQVIQRQDLIVLSERNSHSSLAPQNIIHTPQNILHNPPYILHTPPNILCNPPKISYVFLDLCRIYGGK